MTEQTLSEEDEQAFFSGARSEKMPFVLNDIVCLREGKKKGAAAWVVRVRSTTPIPRYLIELCSGDGDIEISAQEIDFHSS